MISRTYKFIFSHVPKTGGTSIETALYKYADESYGSVYATKNRWYRNKALFDLFKNYPDYRSFAVIRNPHDRLLSTFLFFRRGRKHWINFETFVERACKMTHSTFQHVYRQIPYNFTGLRYIQPQSRPKIDNIDMFGQLSESYPFGDNGNIGYHCLPQSYFIPSEVTNLLNFDDLDNEFKAVCEDIGVPHVVLPKLRRTRAEDRSQFFTPELREMVTHHYQQDFDIFNL